MATLTRGDVRVNYDRVGQGPPVLLVQGVGVIGNGWKPQVDGLADRFTLVTFDNRGIGKSTRGAGPLSVEGLANDAIAVMEAAGFGEFHLVGHSMGGVIAQQVALVASSRVKSLSLLCTFRRGAEATSLSLKLLVLGLRTRVGTRRMRRRAFVEVVVPPAARAAADLDALADRLAPLFGRDLADQPAIVMEQLRAMGAYDAGARLSSLATIPTLVIAGREDVIARAKFGRALAAAIPGARYVELDDAGHGLPIHAAGRVNQLLADHIARAERGAIAT